MRNILSLTPLLMKKIRSLFSWQLYLLGFGFSIGAILLAIGLVQQSNVKSTISQKVDQELKRQAKIISDQIAYKDRWALKGYRRALVPIPSEYFFIIDHNNLLADVEGSYMPKFRNVHVLDEKVFLSAQSISTSYQENWRLLGKKIAGGWVVVGTILPNNINQLNLKEYDKRLKSNIERIGNTIEEAQKIKTRDLDIEVDFSVVNTKGNLVSGFGGIPLKVERELSSKRASSPFELLTDENGRNFYEASFPITGENENTPVATIVVAKDISIELSTIEKLNDINKIALVTALVTTGLGIIFLFPEFFRKPPYLTIEEALKAGEGKHIEFKSTFQCCVGSPEKVNDKRLVILKAIAGFLNGDGGNLFIGIMETPPDPPVLRGIPEDMGLVHDNTDEMRRTLTGLITDRIGRQFSDLISDRIEDRNGKLCWIITVGRSPEPAFVRWKAASDTKEHKHFYVREGPRTADLDLENTWRYINNRWRK